MRFRGSIRFAATACIAIASTLAATAATTDAPARGADRPWLFLSDVHYDTFASASKPANVYSADTNPQLLGSFLAEAKRVAPDPPVVVIAGDFIAHDARRADSAKTMSYLARRFGAAYPHAQFLFTLGNNDSSCGDYAPPLGGDFLTRVARAWEPLVDKNGSARDFLRTFSRDGSYTATLPRRGLRAVVINDNFFTVRYSGKCAKASTPGDELSALRGALAGAPVGSHNWVLFHVPPGIDAFSTSHLTHGLIVVPFLRPRSRDEIVRAIADPRSHVALAIAGHTHKFAFRIVGDGPSSVPMLLVPSISPIFANAPSFLVAPVAADGSLGDVVQYGFDGHDWSRLGALSELGVPRFLPAYLRRLQADLLDGSAHRALFAALYEGGADSEISPRTWSVYACAATYFTDTAFERCTGKRGYSILTRRGIGVAIAGAGIVLAVAAGFALRVRRRRAVKRAAAVEASTR